MFNHYNQVSIANLKLVKNTFFQLESVSTRSAFGSGLNQLNRRLPSLLVFLLFSIFSLSTLPAVAYPDKRTTLNKLIDKGIELYQSKDYVASESIFSDALEQARAESLVGIELRAHRWLIQAMTAQRKYQQAENSCKTEIDEVRKYTKRPHYLVEALCVFGGVKFLQGKLSDAENVFEDAEKAASKGDCDNTYGTMPLIWLGQVYEFQQKWDEAERKFLTALEYTEDNNYDFLGRASLVKMLAHVYHHQGRTDKIGDLYKSVIANFEDNDKFDQQGMAETFCNYASYLVQERQDSEALNEFKRAFEIYERYKTKSDEARKCRSSYAALLRKANRSDEANKIEQSQ